MSITRRRFIKASGLAAVPMALPLMSSKVLLAADGIDSERDQNLIICVFQRGGADGLNIVPPLFDDRYFDLRPTIAVPASGDNAALDLDGQYGLHPSMASLKPFFDDGQLAVIHAAGLTHETHSHFDAQAIMESADVQGQDVFGGWLGRYVSSATMDNGSSFRVVGIGGAIQRSLQGMITPVGIQSVDSFSLNLPGEKNTELLNLLEQLYADNSLLDLQTDQAISSIRSLADIDTAAIEPENDAEYPNSEFGNEFRELASLIKSDIGVQVACVDIGGWDLHDNAVQRLPGVLSDFADTLAAFMTDMGSERMASITIVTMSEFGRRAFENASGGTDHGHGNVMLAMGGGVNGGRVYADWPGLQESDLVFNGDLAITTDYRDVLGELLINHGGLSELDNVFPGYQLPGEQGIFLTRG